MASVRNRVSSIRAPMPMQAPGIGAPDTGYGAAMFGSGNGGSFANASVSGSASVQATGLLIVALVILVVVAERMNR